MLRRSRVMWIGATALTLAGAAAATAGPAAGAASHAWRGMARAAADTVTGCLQQGASPGQFALAAKDGKTYAVVGPKSLAGHVGHMMTLVGSTTAGMGREMAMKDTTGMAGMRDSTKKGGSSMTAGTVHVTAMKMLAPSCT